MSRGQNVTIEYRWADRQPDRLPGLAADLVGRNVDLIVTEGGNSATLAAKTATSTIPVVFQTGDDPVAQGLVASLAHPGGNLTGVNLMSGELIPKLLELLLEVVPEARLIGVLRNPTNPLDLQEAAGAKGVQLHILQAATLGEVDAAFATLVGLQPGGLIVYSLNRARIAALALRHSVPAIAVYRDFPEAGGLISYGATIPDGFRIRGVYAGRILKGEKPADLPVQQPTRFELIINLKTAEALGLTIPQTLLLRADEVIE
jgi:putative ABC transport system substrate-binding protein